MPGRWTGVYGVLAGLTLLHAFRAAETLPPRPIIAAAFTNEEGVRYQPDMMGSLVYAGGYPLEQLWIRAVSTERALATN